jgi:hypothetical protein
VWAGLGLILGEARDLTGAGMEAGVGFRLGRVWAAVIGYG